MYLFMAPKPTVATSAAANTGSARTERRWANQAPNAEPTTEMPARQKLRS